MGLSNKQTIYNVNSDILILGNKELPNKLTRLLSYISININYQTFEIHTKNNYAELFSYVAKSKRVVLLGNEAKKLFDTNIAKLPEMVAGVFYEIFVNNKSLLIMFTESLQNIFYKNQNYYRNFCEHINKAITYTTTLRDISQNIKFEYIDTQTEFTEFLSLLGQTKIKTIWFDLETSNINMLESTIEKFWENVVLLAGFGIIVEHALQIKILSYEIFNNRENLLSLKTVFSEFEFVGHNLNFDIKHTIQTYEDFKITPPQIKLGDDTMLLSYALDERTGIHSLKHLSGFYFDDPDYDDEMKEKYLKPHKKQNFYVIHCIEFLNYFNNNIFQEYLKPDNIYYIPEKLISDKKLKTKLNKFKKSIKPDSYALIPKEVLMQYLAKDIQYTFLLHKLLSYKVKSRGLYEYPYKNLLLLASESLLDIELNGFYFLQNKFQIAKEYVEPKLLEIAEKINEELMEINIVINRENIEKMQEFMFFIPKYNPNSSQQTAKILYDFFNIKLQKNIKQSTNKESIEKIYNFVKENNVTYKQHILKFLDLYREYKKLTKLKTTYINKLPNFVDKFGFSHFSYNLMTETGRTTAGLFLTIPRSYTETGKLIRNMFGVDGLTYEKLSPRLQRYIPETYTENKDIDFVLISCDYSQAELRWYGFIANESFMYNTYTNGLDLHSEVAKIMFGDNYTQEQRTLRAKAYNFLTIYGGSKYTFAQQTGLPMNIVSELVDKIQSKFVDSEKWKLEIVSRFKKDGKLISPLNRHRRLSLVNELNEKKITRIAYNTDVQSVSNDTALLALYKVNKFFRDNNIPAWPVMFLHDDIKVVCVNDEKIVTLVSTEIKEIMNETAKYVQTLGITMLPEIYGDRQIIPFESDVTISKIWGE